MTATVTLLSWCGVCFAAPNVQLPPNCGTGDEFEQEVGRRLGREAKLPPTSLEIVPEGAGYRLRMSVGAQERELRDADCRELFRAAVVVAVAVTLSESTAQPPGSDARREGTSDASPSSGAESDASAVAAGASNLELCAALGAGFNLGLLPGVAPAFELQGKVVLFKHWGFALAGRYIAPATQEADNEGRGVTAHAFGGQVSGLYRPNGYWEAALGGTAYRLAGTGEGPGGRSDTAWAAGPHAGLRFLPLQRGLIWLGLGGELHWNAVRPRFEFLNYGDIFTSSRLDFSMFLQVGPRFP